MLRILIADDGMGIRASLAENEKYKDMIKEGQTSVIENGFWQGTLIYMEIGTGEEIDPNQIVDHRADAAEEYNEAFVETGELESLW